MISMGVDRGEEGGMVTEKRNYYIGIETEKKKARGWS